MHVRPSKINVITLGCSKNLVDSEVVMRQIEAQGISVVHNEEASDADTAIINTCGFILDAKQESIDTILEQVRLKSAGRLNHLFVIGCLSERYKDELRGEVPEVDQFFGVHDLTDILSAIGVDFKKELIGERKLGTPGHYAYLKISEGCDRQCSFCAIPLIRGPQVSRSLDSLLKEAEWLAERGVKELILIAQDLTAYGTDLYGEKALPRLLDALCGIDDLAWIRLHYTYPAGFPTAILEQIGAEEKLCNYLDIPVQHISDPVLKAMRRGHDQRSTRALLRKIRHWLPGAVIRTTLVTGHPGEGEREFTELMDFVKEERFERLGVFTYSAEEGTWGARHLEDRVPASVKKERLETIMALQQSISLEINESRIGSTMRAMVDGREGDHLIARSEHDSPEVDNEILIATKKELDAGSIVDVKITGAAPFDLFAVLA